MKKIFAIGVVLLALMFTLSAVSAEGWSWNFSSESSNGADVSVDNDAVTVQGIKFKIPEGLAENETHRVLGNDSDVTEGAKYSKVTLENETVDVVIKVIYADGETLTAKDNGKGEAKTIGGHNGFLFNDNGIYVFDYDQDGKLVELMSSNQGLFEKVLAK